MSIIFKTNGFIFLDDCCEHQNDWKRILPWEQGDDNKQQIQPQLVNTACLLCYFFFVILRFVGITNRMFTRHWRLNLVYCLQMKIFPSKKVFAALQYCSLMPHSHIRRNQTEYCYAKLSYFCSQVHYYASSLIPGENVEMKATFHLAVHI